MRVAVYPHPCWVWGGTSSAVEGRRAGSLWSRRQQVRPSASVWSSPKCDQSGGRAGSGLAFCPLSFVAQPPTPSHHPARYVFDSCLRLSHKRQSLIFPRILRLLIGWHLPASGAPALVQTPADAVVAGSSAIPQFCKQSSATRSTAMLAQPPGEKAPSWALRPPPQPWLAKNSPWPG